MFTEAELYNSQQYEVIKIMRDFYSEEASLAL